MLRSMDQTQDLKIAILDLKRELAKVREENQLLKVKIRKLQSEVSKRDRQIETLIDPRKSSLIKKVVSERGAMMLVTLRERNNNFEKVLAEKDALIKRLQSDLQTKRLYTGKSADKKTCVRTQDSISNKCTVAIPYYENDLDCGLQKDDVTKSELNNYKSVSMVNINHSTDETACQTLVSQSSPSPTLTRRSHSADRTQFDKVSDMQQLACVNSDMRAQYEGLSRDHLLSIIGSLKNNQQKFSPRIRKGGSPESDLERNELLCDTPHQEIQQLQNYFMDMLSEVDQLKVTISTLKNEQEKTMNVLKRKDSNITKLANEIKILKRPKSQTENAVLRPKRASSAAAQTAVVKKPAQNLRKTRSKSATKVKTEDIDQTEDENTVNICTYREIESEDDEPGLQMISTRTMSIQTLDKPTPNSAFEQTTQIEKLFNKAHCNDVAEEVRNEKEARKQTFGNLLQQMHANMFRLTAYNDT